MIKLKTKNEIAAMREANRLVAEIFAQFESAIQPGISLADLDALAAEYIKRKGAQPLYKGYRGSPATHPPFPGVITASVNHEICHGPPSRPIRLKEGDIVKIDIGLRYQGWCGDSCYTYAVGGLDKLKPEARRLLAVTQECLAQGIAAAKPGRSVGDIGAVIQYVAESQGFSVVSEWGGHGIGRDLHEEPSVPHVGPAGVGAKIRPGMVFTVEPMVNIGKAACKMLKDGWTVVTKDGSLSSQFEHTIAITPNGPEILSVL